MIRLKMEPPSTNGSSAKRALSPGVAPAIPTYQLKITLDLIKPAIWRRLSVPGNASLGWLHAVIQLAMGWTNSHLHQFEVGDRLFSDPAVNSPEFEGDPEVLDEAKFTLRDVAPHVKDVLHYEYDFGDGWQHELLLEEVLLGDESFHQICVAGKRSCPPEDCGGSEVFAELLTALQDTKHPHEEACAWLGDFDPESFSADEINRRLRRRKH